MTSEQAASILSQPIRSSLPHSRFMWTLYIKDPEHWVPIQTVSSFKRMREYKSMGDAWVTKALRLSEELEVNEDGTKVRRRTEVQEPKGQFERSVYAVCAVHILNSNFSVYFSTA